MPTEAITPGTLAELKRDLQLDYGAWDLPGVREMLLERVAELETKLTAAIELINEYECQWGDDYLATKWGLKEQAVAIRGEFKR